MRWEYRAHENTHGRIFLGAALFLSISILALAQPAAVSVTPNSGTGWTQAFAATYSDAGGYTNLTDLQFLVHTAVNGTNACYLRYNVQADAFYLTDDASSYWQGPVRRNTSDSAQNSQCILSGSTSAVSHSGTNITATFGLTFKTAFAGAKTTFMYTSDASTNTGWQPNGSWTVGNPPPPPSPGVTSISPASGTGLSQIFTAIYTDPVSYTNLTDAQFLVQTTVNGYNACYLRYNIATQAFYLANDAAAWQAPIAPSSLSYSENSQCVLSGSDSNATGSGTTLTVHFAIGFKTPFAGQKNTYAYTSNASQVSQWQQPAGSAWNVQTIAQPPASLTVQPSSGTGTANTFTQFAFSGSSVNGFEYLEVMLMLFNWTIDGSNTCYVMYIRSANVIYVINDAGNGWLGGIAPGTPEAFIENNQCKIDVGATTVTRAFNTLTVHPSILFKPSYPGPQKTFLYMTDQTQASGWYQVGSWTGSPAFSQPPTDPPNQMSGTGMSNTFTFHANDVNGYKYIPQQQMLISTNFGDAHSSCSLLYYPSWNSLYLADDANGSWGTPVAPGTPGGTLSNSQCRIDVANSNINGSSGNDLYFTVPITFFPAFGGAKIVSMYSLDHAFNSAGWQNVGSWTVAIAPQQVTLTSVPAGLQLTVDGASCTAPCTYQWTPQSSHTIGASSPQAGSAGTQYLFTSWSDGGAVSHSVTGPASATTYTASFATQYLLTTSASSGGTIAPNTGWYNAGTTATITASANSGYTFSGFSGALSGTTNPRTLTMNSAASVTASFNVPSPLMIATASPLMSGTVGFAYSMSFAASGGSSPYAWSLLSGSLPPGLTLTSGGSLSGTTTTADAYYLTLRVTDSIGNTASKTFSLNVQAASPTPVTASPSSQSVARAVGAAYTIMVTSGAGFSGTVSFTASGLPTGATGTFFPSTVNSSGTTTLTITPSANSPTGTFPITVTAQNGSHSYAIVVVLKVMTPSAANMLTPGPGATLTGSMVTFTWDAGIGASQYQLSLGSTPGGSNYYFANTGSNQGVTATIPNGSPVTVYATLGSLISGSWQSRSYTYTTGIPVSGGTPTITMSSDPSSVRYVLNNNQASVIGPYFLFTCNGSACTATSAGHLKSCDLFGGVSVNSIIRPSQFSSLDHAFDLNVVAVNSAAYGARTLYCTADNGGTVPALPDAFTVYDATPNIEAVIQYPPDSPNGSFWVTVFGTNFGKSFGSLAVCKPGTADPCKDHPTDITPGPGIYYFASDTQINVYMYPAQTALGPYDIQVTGAGSVPAQHFQPAPAGQSKAQSNRGRIQVQCTPTVQITNRPILITLSTSHPGTYEATLTSTASPAGGVYTWTTDNAGMVGFLTPATGSSASQVTLGITSTNDRATITLTYVSPCGASTSDSFTFALSNDTTAVAWVDAAPISVPSINTVMSSSVLTLNDPVICGVTLRSWVNQGNNFIVGNFSDAEKEYAGAYLLSRSANSSQPTTLTSSTALRDHGDYRIYQRFQAYYETNSGVIDPNSVKYLQRDYQAGTTPEPCTGIQLFSLAAEIRVESGQQFVTSAHDLVYQFITARLGSDGQSANYYMNGRTTPYVWTSIQFDANGRTRTFIPGDVFSDISIFPTINVYTGTFGLPTIPQADWRVFVTNNDTYYYHRPQ